MRDQSPRAKAQRSVTKVLRRAKKQAQKQVEKQVHVAAQSLEAGVETARDALDAGQVRVRRVNLGKAVHIPKPVRRVAALPITVPVSLVRSVPLSQAGLGIGIGRTLIGGVFLAQPELGVRVVGLDAGTSTRVTWLARMAAIRDATIGAGTIAAALGRRGETPWLLAGAVSDLVDGTVIGLAAKQKRLEPVKGYTGSVFALGAAGLGFVAAWDSFRRRS